MRTSPLLLAIWACGFATCLQPIGTVCGDELKPVVISDEARAMIDAMVAARRDLKSGIYTATVRHTKTKADQTSVQQTAALRYVFDHSAACLRYENRGDIMIEIGRGEEEFADFVRQVRERTRVSKARMRPIMVYFARNADYSAGWRGIGNRKDDDIGFDSIRFRSGHPKTAVFIRCRSSCILRLRG